MWLKVLKHIPRVVYFFQQHSDLLTHIVIGIEDTGNVLCQIPVQHSLDVASDINCSAQKHKQRVKQSPNTVDYTTTVRVELSRLFKISVKYGNNQP